jgi:hypothetical protein
MIKLRGLKTPLDGFILFWIFLNGDSFGDRNTFLLKKRVLASDRARRPQRKLLNVLDMKYIIGWFLVYKGFIFLFMGLNPGFFLAYNGFIGLNGLFCRFLGV